MDAQRVERRLAAILAADMVGYSRLMEADEAEEKRAQIEDALAEAIEAQKTDADGIVMDSSSWVISARNPG